MINKKQQHLFSRLWRQITDMRTASASKGEFFLLAMAAALLEGCGGGGGGSSGSSGGSSGPSSPTPPLNLKGDDGDNELNGDTRNNIIRGGKGSDNVHGGGGNDIIVVLGVNNPDSTTTVYRGYTMEDLTRVRGTTLDITPVVELEEVNDNREDESVAGETINGGAGDDDTLVVYGISDLSGVEIIGIEHLLLNSDVKVSYTQLGDGGGITAITGGDGAILRLLGDGEVRLSELTLANVHVIDVGAGVTLLAESKAELADDTDAAIRLLLGEGEVRVQANQNDAFEDIQLAPELEIYINTNNEPDNGGKVEEGDTFGGVEIDPPEMVTLTRIMDSVPEDQEDPVKVADISLTGVLPGTAPDLALAGADASLFALNADYTELWLRGITEDSRVEGTRLLLDYESYDEPNPMLEVTVYSLTDIDKSDSLVMGITDVDEPPIVSGDFEFAVGTGRHYQLTVADLSAVEANIGDSAPDIIWRVTARPDNGYLALRSDDQTPVSSFTQAALEAGSVIYMHNGGGGTTDNFAVQAEYDADPPQSADPVMVDVDVVRDVFPGSPPAYSGGNPWLSALLYDAYWQTSPVSAPVAVIEYAFQSGATTEGETGNAFTAPAWNDNEKAAMRSAMATWEAVCNIDFVEVETTESPELEYWKYPASELEAGTLAYHVLPLARTAEPLEGVFGYEAGGWTTGGLMAGGFGFETIVHELGHALGLVHPHEDDGGGGTFPGVPNGAPDEYGDHSLNQGIYTVMGYNSGWHEKYPSHSQDSYGWSGTPMAFDIAAVQELYGVNTASNIGDNIYVLPDGNTGGTYWSCIWDTGGDDTISAAGARQNCEIDLRAADLEGEGGGGYVSYLNNIIGGFTIANTVVIENAVGGNRNDRITGNGADNILTGGGGADIFIFYDNFGSDTITDFDVSRDKIQFIGFDEVTDLNAFAAASEQDGGDVVYDFGDDGVNVLRLMDVTHANLRANNFEQGDDSDDPLFRQYDAYAEAFGGDEALLFG